MADCGRANAGGLVCAGLGLVVFASLSVAVMLGQTAQFDGSVRGTIHRWASPSLTFVMRDITLLGDPVLLVPLAIGLVWWLVSTRRKPAAVAFASAVIGAEIVEQILKVLFQRTRPDAFFGYPEPETYSFPSGHSFVSACFYTLVAAILTFGVERRAVRVWAWVAAIAITAAIGFSRIYLGVHYATDVLAGYAGAAGWVGIVVQTVLSRCAVTVDSTP